MVPGALGPRGSSLCLQHLIPPLSLLQLWDTVHGQLASQHTSPKPVNCVAFHPEGQVLAIGSWAGSCSFFQVDGLKVTKVRRSSVALGEEHRGWEWKAGDDGRPHFVSLWAVLRAALTFLFLPPRVGTGSSRSLCLHLGLQCAWAGCGRGPAGQDGGAVGLAGRGTAGCLPCPPWLCGCCPFPACWVPVTDSRRGWQGQVSEGWGWVPGKEWQRQGMSVEGGPLLSGLWG